MSLIKSRNIINQQNSDLYRMIVVDNLKGQTVGVKVSENIKYDTVVNG